MRSAAGIYFVQLLSFIIRPTRRTRAVLRSPLIERKEDIAANEWEVYHTDSRGPADCS